MLVGILGVSNGAGEIDHNYDGTFVSIFAQSQSNNVMGFTEATAFTVAGTGVNGIWKVNGSGIWNSASNWTGGVPGLTISSPATDTATFDNTTLTAGTSATVSLNGVNPSLKGITFNTTGGGYTIDVGTPNSGTTLNGASAATVTVTSGTHTIVARSRWRAAATVTLGNTSSLTLSGQQTWAGHNVTVSGPATGNGTFTISGSQANASAATLRVNANVTANLNTDGGANLTVANNATTNLNSSQTLASLQTGVGAHTNVTTSTGITSSGSSVIVTPSLIIAGSADNFGEERSIWR